MNINSIKEKITKRHGADQRQLEIIYSESKRLIVEAPAGYGKTNTMVSKIAYMLISGQIPSPKKILVLSFSVNAAYKIKKDLGLQIPLLLKDTGFNFDFNEKILVSNYHGFCRRILKKYGEIYNPILKHIDRLQSIDDSDPKKVGEATKGIRYELLEILSDFNESVKKVNQEKISNLLDEYNSIVINELLPQKVIPYNAILTLTIKLFVDYPQIIYFYKKYFSSIIVDEYQDTNMLGYLLITMLFDDKMDLILLGDSLQRIYGFIGAVPNLLKLSENHFRMTKITLDKNYRFASNPEMLLLDFNIRKNAENVKNPIIKDSAKINLAILNTQEDESNYIVQMCKNISGIDSNYRIAILVKQRGKNVEKIIRKFEDSGINYFYGLFTDEDTEYIKFHKECLFEFIELIKIKKQLTKNFFKEHINLIVKKFSSNNSLIIKSLISLLSIFWNNFFTEFSFLENNDKINFVRDTFENYSLKQYLEFSESKIIVSTIHAAKGLEWDFVIIPDMEQDSFPNWFGLCGACLNKSDCNLEITDSNEVNFLEELSVFYVAVTRARKQVFFTASNFQLDRNENSRRKNLSCLMKLKGIVIKD